MLALIDRLGSDELPADLGAAARELGSRKVVRHLEEISLAPFVAGCALVARHGDIDRRTMGLFTVSGWESGVPEDEAANDGSLESHEVQTARFLQLANPVQWLSGLANNALCQIAVASQIQGPNAHWVGDGRTLLHALDFAAQLIADGAAETALVVCFDPPRGHWNAPPRTVPSIASAILVSASTSGSVIELSELRSHGEIDPMLAAEALAAIATHAEQAAAADRTAG